MKKTVLIIDATDCDRLTYRSYLQADPTGHYEIIEAETLKKGLELWRSQPIDSVLLTLSDDQGIDFLKAIGQGNPEKKLPVLILVNQQDEQVALRALSLGAMDYAIKDNLTILALSHRLGTLIERQAAEIALQNADNRLSAKATELRDLSQQLAQIQAELSRTEEELKERNLQLASKWLSYQDLFNVAPDGYLITHPKGKIQQANQSILDLLSISEERLLNQPLMNFVDPLDQNKLHHHLEQLSLHPQGQTWEMRLQSQSGASFPVEVTVIPHWDEKGMESHLRWFVRNISLRKRAEAALLESDLRFKTSFDHAAIGMCLTSTEGRFLAVNPAFCRIVGYSEPELLALNFHDITAPEDLPADLDQSAQLLRGEIQSFNLEKRYQHKNGQLIWTLLTVSLVRDEQQQGSYFIAQIQDISDRKQAEAALKQLNQELEQRVEQRTAALQRSEARLQESQKVARLGSWEFEVTTGKIIWSPELFHIYGLNPKQPEPTYEEHLQNFCVPDRERLRQAVNRAIKRGESYALDLQIIRADGSTGYIFAKGEAIRNASGQVIRLLGIAMDISDRKQVEQELSQSRDLQAVIFNESTDALFLVDPKTMRTLDCNQRAVELFAAPDKNALINRAGHTLQSTHFSANELAEILRQIRTRGFWSQELQYITLQGELFWGNIVAKPITIARKRLNLVQITDISYRKQAEANLIASEERFQKIALTSPSMIYILVRPAQGSSYFEYISAAAQDIHEYRPEEILNDASLYFKQIHPDDRPRYDKAIVHHQQTLQPFCHEWRIVTPSGQVKWIQANSRPEKRQNGDVAWHGIILDISDRKQVETQLQSSNEQLAISNAGLLRATRHKDEFLSIMSHELRTPLNAILGMAATLKEQKFGAIKAPQHKALDTIEERGTHLLNLINDILHFTEIETQLLPSQCVPTAIPTLCQSSLSVVEPLAAQKHLQILLKIAPHLPEFLLDELRIRQVLTNLLNNAVKFTPKGGIVTLEVTCESPSSPVSQSSILRIQVKDTGIGIASQDLHQLFQPFFQIDTALSRQYGGIGLGLTLTKRIVESLGGSIAVHSKVSVGSCFTVEIPGVPIALLPESSPLLPTVLAPATSELAELSRLILLAEDHEANRCSLSNYLLAQKKRYHFIFARTGQAALDLARAQQPDLILLNMQLPDIEGLEILSQIKQDHSLAQIRVIAMSALATLSDRDRALAAGADDYVTKPVSLKPLATRIQQLLAPED